MIVSLQLHIAFRKLFSSWLQSTLFHSFCLGAEWGMKFLTLEYVVESWEGRCPPGSQMPRSRRNWRDCVYAELPWCPAFGVHVHFGMEPVMCPNILFWLCCHSHLLYENQNTSLNLCKLVYKISVALFLFHGFEVFFYDCFPWSLVKTFQKLPQL